MWQSPPRSRARLPNCFRGRGWLWVVAYLLVVAIFSVLSSLPGAPTLVLGLLWLLTLPLSPGLFLYVAYFTDRSGSDVEPGTLTTVSETTTMFVTVAFLNYLLLRLVIWLDKTDDMSGYDP